ncbi:MAG TPA: HAD hydrolase-like protein [Candidatus Nanoarchaeia archaeon]|nr:HAD hydrolase-like protein [Candidatus Nanoarchaeia archaeon]
MGNRLDVDIQGAHNAGMKGILLLCGKYAGQSPVSLLLQRGINAKEILSGKYDKEIRAMMPEYTIDNILEIKRIL